MQRLNIIALIVKVKVCFDRGFAYVKYLQYPFMLFTFLKIFDIAIVSIAIPLIVTVGIITVVLGYTDFKRGIWRHEQNFLSGKVNPFFKQMDQKLDKIINWFEIDKEKDDDYE